MENWNPEWNASTQVRKQRKFRYNAPAHVLRKFLGVHLAEPLRKRYQTRSVAIRVGDKVQVMRGQHKGKTGKVSRLDVEDSRVFVEGVEFTKKDGTKILPPIHPSNLLVTEVETGDKRRVDSLKKEEAAESRLAKNA